MENQKQKKSVGTILLVILLLIVTIASLILATYAWAKYSSITTGEGTAQVAKWDVGVSFDHSNYNKQTFTHVIPQRLAPGTSGQFDITIDAKNTEVDFTYEVTLEKVETVNGNGTVPKHLHFYTNNNHGKDDLIDDIEGTGDAADESVSNGSNVNGKLSGTINASTEKNKKEVVTIYWEWPYENPDTSTTPDTLSIATPDATPTLTPSPNGIPDYDDQDTIDGMNASQIKVTYNVITTQVKPSPSPAE